MAAQEQDNSSDLQMAESIQKEAADLLSMHMAAIGSVCPTPALQPGGNEYAKVAGVMANLAMETARSRARLRRAAEIIDKKDSFEALIAIGLAIQNQEIEGLARFHAATLRQSQNVSHRLSNMAATGQTSAQAQGSEVAVEGAVPVTINDGIITVYPGHSGEPFWTAWKGKYPNLSEYPADWELLLTEWQRGIVYSDEQHVTVPLQQLEKDLAEGRQAEHTGYAPWRQLPRKPIHERKVIIYSMLGAREAGQEVEDFIKPYHNMTQDIIEAAKGKKGPKPAYMSTLFKLLVNDFKQKYKTPVEFERTVLKWKHTTTLANQAASKQPAQE
ncbi:TPA: hypothetical protein ACH3X2_012861 [Trebouxia sp. C0005]